jgi:protocatechuate 3,4-dioxygenase beta subunit
MGVIMPLSRRDLVAKCMALGVLTSTSNFLPSALAEAWEQKETLRKPTPAGGGLGPFYKRLAPSTNMLREPGDPGMPLVVAGQIFDTRGAVVPGATVEVWQTNHLGIYDLDGYRYRAKLTTSAEGKYDFSSVMPGHYPARVCQHVHFLVTAPGHKPLITQMYFATDPVFEGDPDKNYARDPLIATPEVIRPVTLVGDPKDIHAAVRFEPVLEVL